MVNKSLQTPSLPLSVGLIAEQASDSANFAVPRKGHVLSTAARAYGAPLRAAAQLIAEAMTSNSVDELWQRLYARRRAEPEVTNQRKAGELSSWMLVSAWTLGVSTGRLSTNATLIEAESWFLGDKAESGIAALVSDGVRRSAEMALHSVTDRKALYELMPYVLDPHGEGSRLSVMLRPETAATRARKRAEGVFYTPADVAEFMAAGTIRHLGEEAIPLTVFDPACGSGVFLRAVLSELRRRSPDADAFDIACSCLYGTDIDPWAVNAAAFIVLADCFESVHARCIAPVTAWHAIRLNFAHLNALRLEPGRALPHDDSERIARLECRARLKAGELPAVSGVAAPAGPLEFQLVFPELAEGARIVIGNPPYANIGIGNDLLSLSKRFETFRSAPRPTSDMYPLFVEQMTRLAAPNAHGGAMVLPLSVACNTGRQYLSLRHLIARTDGHWRFAFFDREPHALFGEDVKTRNAIVLWTRQGAEQGVQISTGPLRKWRGGDRARMLGSLSFTPIEADIRTGIPKIEGSAQAHALVRLMTKPKSLLHAVTHIGRSTLEDAMLSDSSTVFVAGTAYNFLSVFLRPPSSAIADAAELTENPMLALCCPSHDVALQVFALLSSRIAFWWWHAHGDGFHVSRHVIETMPVGEALHNPSHAAELTRLGSLLWQEISLSPVISRNKGKTSLGFSAASSPLRQHIDALLVTALNLAPDFAIELERHCDGVTTAQVSSQNVEINSRVEAHELHTVGRR